MGKDRLIYERENARLATENRRLRNENNRLVSDINRIAEIAAQTQVNAEPRDTLDILKEAFWSFRS
jgi:hypothetical protein